MNQTLVTGRKSFLLQIVPVMLCFFAMGFVDLVGTASNYVQKDLNLTDSQANLFPSLVFFWFLIFSVPTGMLMNKIGRKSTVLISLIVTAISLFIPVFGNSYVAMLASFSLLGIGNAIMQTSLNPLVTNLISSEKLASTLTFGQFIKAIASFLAPVIAAWGGYNDASYIRSRVESPVCDICNCQFAVDFPFGCDTDRRRKTRQGVRYCSLSETARTSVHPTLFHRHHVPCRNRCRDKHQRSKNNHGATRTSA